MCCDIKVKKKLDGCVIIDSPRLWSRYKYFVQTLHTIRSTSVIVCMYKKSTEPCSERNFQFEEEKAEESTRANSQLSRGSCSSRLQFVQSKLPINENTNIAAEVCKVARKRTSGLTVTLSRPRFFSIFLTGGGGLRKPPLYNSVNIKATVMKL